ncbi:hypothetical protein HPO96_23010 [Kribbella sandramycini]|uniref:Uncharacterized protein n=1 Tax=Kribbella sandramycini TaxID=60450 RepID=A0A7Y4L465_9ACTN|nr:DUF5691 domain-containing protein [Kribbella sandramycini]MBB6566212.1 hypothetical protein [Kribbella sandramycini]NOL43122.1 hypothetical protein [Kribbella sandramycini]
MPEEVRERLGEGGLLDAAALATVYRRAGRRPLRGVEVLGVAGGEDRPLPGAAAVRRLAAMLGGFQTTALGEWLRAAETRGWGVPPEYLPELADHARHRAEYRPLVIAAAGRRASWLADLNPEWRFLHAVVAEGNNTELWTHGDGVQRRSWLRDRRRAEPADALEALREVWPTESAATRADFLTLLVDGLSLDDEDFLEAALDDRSREVRRAAARLLTQLPGSRLQQRMTERLHTHLLVTQGVLAIDLPRTLTPAMERDGIEARVEGLGQRAGLLRQLIAATPLAEMDLEWLRLPAEGVAVGVLQSGWTEAVIREGSQSAPSREQATAWARELLRSSANTGTRSPAELLRLLPPDEWAAAVAALRKTVDITELVGGLPVPWPETLATDLLDQLAKAGTGRDWARLASVTARAVPPEVLDHPITRESTGEEDTWRRRLVETLTFRREMYEELS